MTEYGWNPYQDDQHASNEFNNADWNFDPRDENYYLGRINNDGNIDMDQRYYSDGSDRYYRKDEVQQRFGSQPSKYAIKDVHPYKNNDFYGERKRNFSWGPHWGKGPKNYTRSEGRIREDASERLMEDSLVDASNIELWFKDNELVLSGSVETKFEKRRAEHLVENIPGVKHVQNNLKVAGNRPNIPQTFG